MARIPAHDLSAEEAVLSSMLFDSHALTAAIEILDEKDFYKPAHGEIYAAICATHDKGVPADIITVGAELSRRGKIHDGMDWMAYLASAHYTSANIVAHAQEVRRHSESRQITIALTELLQKPECATAADLADVAKVATERQYVKEHTSKALSAIEEFKTSLHKETPHLNTGFSQLDNLIGGIRHPSVFTVGAYPSVGKTTFALNIAANQHVPVIIFSLEMSHTMIFERLAAAKLGIDYSLFRSKKNFAPMQIQRMEQYADTLAARKFFVFDDVDYVEQQVDIVSRHKPQLVIVDYMQIVRTHKSIESKRLEIDYISAEYKKMARQHNCVVLLLSQLARPDVNIASAKAAKAFVPTMRWLKESGAMEANSDYVGILHRPFVLYKREPEVIREEDGHILIDKNKFGRSGIQKLRFEGRTQQFYEIDIPVISSTERNIELPF